MTGPAAPCGLCAEPTTARVCATCRGTLDADLSTVPRLYLRAHLALRPGGTGGATEYISGGAPGGRSPVADRVLHAADHLARTVADWETLAVATEGLPERVPLARQGAAVNRAVGTLRVHLGAALANADGVDLARATRRAVAALRTALGLEPHVQNLALPCPDCGCTALIRTLGEPVVSCRMCKARWTDDTYRLLAQRALSESPD